MLLRARLPEEPQHVLLDVLVLEGAAGRHVQQLDPLVAQQRGGPQLVWARCTLACRACAT
eukprot:14648293-Alexandrium_andersonii.AAC.1